MRDGYNQQISHTYSTTTLLSGWGRHVDIYICTDAYTPYGQEEGPDEVWLGDAHRDTQSSILLGKIMQRGGAEMGSHIDIHTCSGVHTSDCCGTR